MQDMEDNSVDFIVTDSPYGISFMSKQWDKEIPPCEYWKEMLRIVKPGGHLCVAGLPRMVHRLGCIIEDSGWTIRDMIMHLFGSGFPKSHNHFGLEGYGTALKPAWEGWILAMKPLDGTYAQNVEKWGIGGINIDESRIATCENRSRKCVGPKNKITYAKFSIKDTESHEKGRWPSNLILDEESARLLRDSSRFFKCVENDCFLCYNPCTKAQDKECKNTDAFNAKLNSDLKETSKDFAQSHALQSIQQNNEVKSELSIANANNAKSNSAIMQETNQFIAQNHAQIMQEEQFVLNVKFAESLCERCATNIVRGLVATKNSDFKIEELQATLDYIGNFKSSILIHNLVLFAEQWENIDIIPTTESLLKLFGCVRHVIESYTRKENLDQHGNNEQLRFRYTPKASSRERNAGLEGMPEKQANPNFGSGGFSRPTDQPDREIKPAANFHPTVKPIALMKYIIKLLAPPGNPIMLDPFLGSGTSLIAARELGIRAIGIELNQEYCDIARKRIEHAQFKPDQLELFNG